MKRSKSKPPEQPFTTTHNLLFEVAEWEWTDDFMRFRIGTCDGLWRVGGLTYDILAIDNDAPGNGHFEDVLQLFSHYCQRDRKALRIMHVWNRELAKHLINKRGFTAVGEHCIKKFN